MPILDLQRQMMEIGRLRLGQQVDAGRGKMRPAKLETWRFTSANESVIRQAAKLYGGDVQPWQAPSGPQFELISDTTSLPVLVPPAALTFSQWYETWTGGGCTRRCDGITETISDQPCLCDPDARECKIHSRLSVLLSDLSGLGVWRVETSGWYAARELSAAVEVIGFAASHGQMLPAQLRLEQRMTKRPGQGTRRFAVPVLDIAASPTQLLAGTTHSIKAPPHSIAAVAHSNGADAVNRSPDAARTLTLVPDSVPEHPVPSIAEQAVATRSRPARKNAAQPIPATGIKPRTRTEATAVATAEPPPDPADATDQLPLDTPELITKPQLTKLSILLKEAGLTDRDAAHDFTAQYVGHPITSAKELTMREASDLIDMLENDTADRGTNQ